MGLPNYHNDTVNALNFSVGDFLDMQILTIV